MFKHIISRDNGCPWGETGMTSAKWLDIPTAILPIRELIATQPGVLLHAHYLEDGHHRVVRARLNGRRAIRARVLSLD